MSFTTAAGCSTGGSGTTPGASRGAPWTKAVEDHLPVLAPGAGNLLHRLDAGAHSLPTSREPFPDEDGTHFAASRVPDRRDRERKASICVERVVALYHLPGLCLVKIAILIMNHAALGRNQFPTAEIRSE